MKTERDFKRMLEYCAGLAEHNERPWFHENHKWYEGAKADYLALLEYLQPVIANADPDSKVTVMTLVKQCSVLVTIAAGKILYKEKYILRKLFCAGIILAGIVLAVL